MAQKSNRRTPSTKQEAPPAPWGSFPLMQLAVLAGLIFIVLGAITGNLTQLGVGLALGSLGGLELSIREHFAGYRSHTTLLAGVVFVLGTGITFFFADHIPGVKAPELWVCLVVGVTLGGVTWGWLRQTFEKKAGVPYKLR